MNDIINYVPAAESISKYDLLTINSDGYAEVINLVPAEIYKYIGIALNDVDEDGKVKIQIAGIIDDPELDLTVGVDIYIRESGISETKLAIEDVSETEIVSFKLGKAISETQILIDKHYFYYE